MESTTMPNALRRLLVIFGALLIVSLLASGANIYMTLAAPRQAVTVPNRVGFEGRLADSNGDPAEGSYTLTFSLYSLAEGGDPVWIETQPTVPVHNGLYSVQLGTTTPLQPSHFDGPRWLGVKVGTAAEMTPRVPISSVPFALNAQEAAHAEEADEAAQALGLQGNSVSADTPTDGQALIWDASGSEWLPSTIPTPESTFAPNARVYNSSAIALPADTTMPLPFNSERFDNDNIHSTSTDPTRLVVNTPGTYLLFGGVYAGGSDPSGIFGVGIRVNGTMTYASSLPAVQLSGSVYYWRTTISTVCHLNAGDYIELMVGRAGSALTVLSESNYSPEFGMVWMGD